MSKRYPGGVIRQTPDTPTQASATGVWNMTDVTQAQQTNNWPVANVPNPMSRSLRFRSGAGAWLSRTPTVATNRKTYTWSGWVKSSLANTSGADMPLFTSRPSAGVYTLFQLKGGTNYLQFGDSTAGGVITTTQVFRDPSAWYHIVLAVDTTQATNTNRVKMYVNGVQITSFSATTYPSQNADTQIDAAQIHGVGRDTYDTSAIFDGYMAEVNFVDGQALAPTAFGQYDQFSNWTSKQYTGTYGTNGFYLPFKNYSSTGTLGLDYSGNNNNWAANNFSVTTGSTYDSMTDVPTQWTPYNVTGDVGGIIRGNYCVMNPLTADSNATFSNGNLTIASNTTGEGFIPATMDFDVTSSYGYYFEVTVDSNPAYCTTGFIPVSKFPGKMWTGGTYPGQSTYNPGFEIRFSDGTILQNGGSSAYGSGATAGDTWGFAIRNGKVWARNSSGWFNSGNPVTEANPAVTGQTGQWLLGYAERAGGFGAQCTFNFGQTAFTYAPPSGYKSLCTTNLPTPTIQQGNLVMDATLYTGTGSAQSITNAGAFKPDFVWAKSRSNALFNNLMDSVRGTNKDLYSNSTAAEETNAQIFTAINSNGFSVGTDASANTSGATYVGWQWQAGQGTTSTNTSGSITSTVSVNPTAGFSIVSYTGNGSAGATVGHGLGVTPALIIAKKRSSTGSWQVYSNAISNMTAGYITLNGGSGFDTGTSTIWNNTSPTSTVFTLGTDTDANANGATTIAYCWAEVAGYSKSLAWAGNGSTDGPFVYCGFSPAFILIKRTNAVTDWVLIDNKRLGYNVTDVALNPNAAYAENSGYATDFTANGFKLRTTTGYMNASGGTYIGFAFASYPFKSALAR